MNPNQHFFQAFFGPQINQVEQKIPEYIIQNEFVLEIMNNWDNVNDLIKRFKAGKVQQVDQLEQTWLNFINQRNIDIFLYKNEEEFCKTFWVIPNN